MFIWRSTLLETLGILSIHKLLLLIQSNVIEHGDMQAKKDKIYEPVKELIGISRGWLQSGPPSVHDTCTTLALTMFLNTYERE